MKCICASLVALCWSVAVKEAVAEDYLAEDVLMAKRSAIEAGARAIEKLIANKAWPGPDRLVGTVVSVESQPLPLIKQVLHVNDPILNSKRVIKIAVRWPPDKQTEKSLTVEGRFYTMELVQDSLNRRDGKIRVSMDPFFPEQTLAWDGQDPAETSGIFERIEVLPAKWANGLADLGAGIEALRRLDQKRLLKSCAHENAILGTSAFALLLGNPQSTEDELVTGCEAGNDDVNIAIRTLLGLKSRSDRFGKGLKSRASTVTDESIVDGMALGCYAALRYGPPDIVREIDRIAAFERFGKHLEGDVAMRKSLWESPAINALLTFFERRNKAVNAENSQKGRSVVEMLANALRIPQAFGGETPKK